MSRALILACLVLLQSAPRSTFFQTPLTLADMKNKQAVVETTMGTFVMALLPEAAPNHVGHFIKTARDGGYNGTIFHRVVRYGMIQGGDPLSKDPAKSAQYGMGGLNELKSEYNADEKYTAGAVAAVLAGGKPDSAGAQFFICVTDQPKLEGQYTVFARIVDGLDIVAAISAMDADAKGMPAMRVEIKSVTIRDPPPPAPVPFAKDTAAELANYRATIETPKGAIVIEMLASKAPETVRAFLQAAQAGVYDGTPFHRVVKGFVIQVGSTGNRTAPLTAAQQKFVHNLQPEFSATPHVPGIVSMARGEAPDSAQTSFFICTGECRALDGQYTVFARVVSGMDVVQAIEAAPVDGETPKEPVMVTRVTVTGRGGTEGRPNPPMLFEFRRGLAGALAKADFGRPNGRLKSRATATRATTPAPSRPRSRRRRRARRIADRRRGAVRPRSPTAGACPGEPGGA